jgi:hypothetical protein
MLLVCPLLPEPSHLCQTIHSSLHSCHETTEMTKRDARWELCKLFEGKLYMKRRVGRQAICPSGWAKSAWCWADDTTKMHQQGAKTDAKKENGLWLAWLAGLAN